jgi:two-component system, NarL family, nitrate/nitrite response regulator NarL
VTHSNEANRTIGVLLVSGLQLFAEAVALSLGYESRVHILGVRPTIASLYAQPDSPDVLVAIGAAADGSASEVVRTARQRWPDVALVATADSDRYEDVLPLLQAGADGFLTRSSSLRDLVTLVDRAYRHEQLLHPTVIEEIARRVDAAKREPRHPAHVGRLTRREMEILRSLKEGLGPSAIAERDGTSRATVRTHVHNILRKLGAHSILEAITFSIRHGIVDAPSAASSPSDTSSLSRLVQRGSSVGRRQPSPSSMASSRLGSDRPW